VRVVRACSRSGGRKGGQLATLGIQVPGPGRDPLADVVALVEQTIAALRLPARNSQPYPAPVATALHS
jgi:hypothetical protein